jgi:hypothetical protein
MGEAIEIRARAGADLTGYPAAVTLARARETDIAPIAVFGRRPASRPEITVTTALLRARHGAHHASMSSTAAGDCALRPESSRVVTDTIS